MAQFSVAGALLIERNGDYLLQRRDDKPEIASPNMLSIFGGHLNSNESLLECATRELREETGLVLKPKHLNPLAEMDVTYGNGTQRLGGFYVVTNIDASKLTITEGTLERISPSSLFDYFREMVPTTAFLVSLHLQEPYR